MGCERRRAALSRLAAGEPVRAGLTTHLTGCPECQGALAAARRALDRLDAELGDLAQRKPGQGFESRVLEAVQGRAERAGSGWWRWAAATAAGVAAVGLLLHQVRQPSDADHAPLSRPGVPELRTDAVGRAPEASEAAGSDEGATLEAVTAVGSPRGGSAPEPGRSAGRRAPARQVRPTTEVRVPTGQLEALVQYARLRSRRPPAKRAGLVDEPLLGIDPIRIDPLSIEPLSFDLEGARR